MPRSTHHELGDILATLAPLFEAMYVESLSMHPTEEIAMELQFLHSLSRGNSPDLSQKGVWRDDEDFQKFVSCSLRSSEEGNPNQYEMLLDLGTVLNEYYLHNDAITTLTKAIVCDKHKLDAYIERAHAYFELDRLDLALKDYQKIRHIKNKQRKGGPEFEITSDEDFLFFELLDEDIEDENDLYICSRGWDKHYISGFCSGAKKGATEACKDYIPNTLTCCRGILHALWSFAKNPKESSEHVIEASYHLVERLRNDALRDHLEVLIPELKELFSKWDSMNSYNKGEKIGYIIGKYGVDIVLPFVTIKSIKHFMILKRANTLATLKKCADKVDNPQILAQSTIHAKARQTLWRASKSGKIIPQDGNKIPHIMQKKHAWDKVLKISGNQNEDFQRVATFLEQHKVLSKLEFVKEVKTGIKLMRCEKKIQGYLIEARFIQYESGEIFLTNAYVKTN